MEILLAIPVAIAVGFAILTGNASIALSSFAVTLIAMAILIAANELR
ncbi:MAG: hypothetical protein HYW05_00790 [Candidatus Diapherotrites archaeon]|nr:hypothetical protein [Candidatus Diapherotrites archaeon]